LQSERPPRNSLSRQQLLTIPNGYLPRSFRVEDACVTNASSVWLWKHFYL
jgi:hypothetical protein